MTEPTQEEQQNEELYVGYGDNPREDVIRRRKKAEEQTQRALNNIMEMGTLYASFGEEAHSEYCMALYAVFQTALTLLTEFKADQ